MPDGKGGYRFAATSEEKAACADERARGTAIVRLRCYYREAIASLDGMRAAVGDVTVAAADYDRILAQLGELANAHCRELGWEGPAL